jgi:hypothetical protein
VLGLQFTKAHFRVKAPAVGGAGWGEAGSRWPCGCRSRTAAAGGRPQAGLEDVEKVLTATSMACQAERDTGMLLPLSASRSAITASTVNRRGLLAGAPSGLDWRGGRPPQAWTQLLGDDLDDLAGAAVLSGPGPLLEPAHDHHPAAPAQRLGGVLGLVPPHDHGEERRPCSRRPDTATRNMARAIPASVCRSSGSSVRLPAKLTLASVMLHPLLGLPGRAGCPALEPGNSGRLACRKANGGKR